MRVSSVDEIMPPIMGTAIRCMISEPVPVLHMIGSKPALRLGPVCWRDMSRRRRCDDSRKNDRPPSDWPFLACPPGRREWKGDTPAVRWPTILYALCWYGKCWVRQSEVNHLNFRGFRARFAI